MIRNPLTVTSVAQLWAGEFVPEFISLSARDRHLLNELLKSLHLHIYVLKALGWLNLEELQFCVATLSVCITNSGVGRGTTKESPLTYWHLMMLLNEPQPHVLASLCSALSAPEVSPLHVRVSRKKCVLIPWLLQLKSSNIQDEMVEAMRATMGCDSCGK